MVAYEQRVLHGAGGDEEVLEDEGEDEEAHYDDGAIRRQSFERSLALCIAGCSDCRRAVGFVVVSAITVYSTRSVDDAQDAVPPREVDQSILNAVAESITRQR